MRAVGAVATGIAAMLLLGACSLGGLSGDAKAVADACGKLPGTSVESCGCVAKELQGKLKPELLKVAAIVLVEPGRLLDPAVGGNISANDVTAITGASAGALKTCKITS